MRDDQLKCDGHPKCPNAPTHAHLGSRAFAQLNKYFCDACCPLSACPDAWARRESSSAGEREGEYRADGVCRLPHRGRPIYPFRVYSASTINGDMDDDIREQFDHFPFGTCGSTVSGRHITYSIT